MLMTEKEAWTYIAKSYFEKIEYPVVGYTWNNKDGIPGICHRIDVLFVHDKITHETRHTMTRKIKYNLGNKLWLSRSKDVEARGLFCLLQAQMC